MKEKRFFGTGKIGYCPDPEDEQWVVFFWEESGKREPIARVRRRVLDLAALGCDQVATAPSTIAVAVAMRELVAATYRAAGATVTMVDVEPSPGTN